MKDQVMIVTGAAMGLGLAAAKVLAARGAAGALVDYNADALKTAQAELAAECPQAKTITVTADVSDEAAVKRYVPRTGADAVIGPRYQRYLELYAMHQ